jgi:hypothetical protein
MPYGSSNDSAQHLSLPQSNYPDTPKERLAVKRLWNSVGTLKSDGDLHLTASPQFIPESMPCRLYISVLILQTVVDLAIEGALVLKFQQAAKLDQGLEQSSARRLPVYFSIFGFAQSAVLHS